MYYKYNKYYVQYRALRTQCNVGGNLSSYFSLTQSKVTFPASSNLTLKQILIQTILQLNISQVQRRSDGLSSQL